jgi:prepilin-type N-terminal cleavage/methylation domain-containing protein
MNKQHRSQYKGFTLLEILLVITAIGIFAALVLVAINPNRQIEAARQLKRNTDISNIVKAIQQYRVYNKGEYPEGIEIGAKAICQTGSEPTECINLSSSLVPRYIAAIPAADSNNYYIRKDITGKNIEVTHPSDTIWSIGGSPSLDLNFAKNKSLIDSVSGNNLITFTRNSPATYVGEDGLIKTAGPNEPRFDHNPVTGESLGLLVEEQRSNLFLHSIGHNASQWINQGSSETINTAETLSPDGTNNATKLFGNNGVTTRQSIYQGVSVTSGTTYTFSVFLKQGQRRYATIWFDSPNISQGAFFGASSIIDLQTGVLATGSTTKIVPYPNGWYRVYVTATPTATQSMNMNLSVGGPNNNNGAPYDATGDGTSGIYIWGSQVEVGSFPTSYIPTTNITPPVPRSADTADITDSNFNSWYNQSEGSFFTLSDILAPNQTASGVRFANGILKVVDNTINNVFSRSHYYSPHTSTRIAFGSRFSGSVGFCQDNGLTINNNIIYKSANGYTNGVSLDSLSVNSRSIINGSSITTVPVSTRMLIGRGYFGGIAGAPGSDFMYLNGHISRLSYWPTRLSNATLQSITK